MKMRNVALEFVEVLTLLKLKLKCKNKLKLNKKIFK